ncbi:MAG: EcsC family protein [Oscillospiraceae bacterium]|nr:EcsC family protein [Oscillospiraceae bacterium]
MCEKTYVLPEEILDAKEVQTLTALTELYSKMITPSVVGKTLGKLGEKIPQSIKDVVAATGKKMSETEMFVKAMEYLANSFQTLEQFAAKVTISKAEIIKQVNQISPNNEITVLDEICLVRSYELSQLVNKYKFADIIAALAEGAATGAAGFVGIPFNLVLSTFLFYRAVQSIALFYGYDVKNDPAELQIASEVFMRALNPKGEGETEMSGAIAKVMLLTSTTTVKQTVKKGWTAMADKGGVTLLLTQIRALANGAAKKALGKAGKKGLEKTAFTEVFEQIGKNLTQKSINKAIPYIGAFIGAGIDTAQMIQITQFAEVFYCKRFILEKESRIYTLTGEEIPCIETAEDTEE